MGLNFRKITLDDRERIHSYLSRYQTRSCEKTFANMFLWGRFYPVEYAEAAGMLLLKRSGARTFFEFPVGERSGVKDAVEAALAYCVEQGIEPAFGVVTPQEFEILDSLYPGEFTVSYDRDAADYIYETEKLANLSGKKYHGKKNHINKFIRQHPQWSYEPITAANAEECFQMALIWRRENGCEEDEEKSAEMCVTLNALRLFAELGLRGGLLRADGRVVAFSIGEPVGTDTMVVHIEKAFSGVEGAYPMINRQFVLHEAMAYKYVNREDDVGQEGLRRAKLSYHPVFLLEKGMAVKKNAPVSETVSGETGKRG